MGLGTRAVLAEGKGMRTWIIRTAKRDRSKGVIMFELVRVEFFLKYIIVCRMMNERIYMALTLTLDG